MREAQPPRYRVADDDLGWDCVAQRPDRVSVATLSPEIRAYFRHSFERNERVHRILSYCDWIRNSDDMPPMDIAGVDIPGDVRYMLATPREKYYWPTCSWYGVALCLTRDLERGPRPYELLSDEAEETTHLLTRAYIRRLLEGVDARMRACGLNGV